jgi:chromosome segregation ATPase
MSRHSARVHSIDAIKRFKAGLIEFVDLARLSLTEAQTDVQRTIHWLQHDQILYWNGEVRRRTELVSRAKSELYRAKMASADNASRCVEERNALKKAERRLEEAGEKIKAIRHWVRQLEREMHQFRGQTQHLANALEQDVPISLAKLDKMVGSLEDYIKIAPPSTEPRNRGTSASEDPAEPEDEQ